MSNDPLSAAFDRGTARRQGEAAQKQQEAEAKQSEQDKIDGFIGFLAQNTDLSIPKRIVTDDED